MKIILDDAKTLQSNDYSKVTNAYQRVMAPDVKGAGAYFDVRNSLDEGSTYEVKSKSWKDQIGEITAKDVQVTQDYMTVMSNSMSQKDFAKMCASGERPAAIPAEDCVNILDEIKLAVAKGGTEVEGFTDTLSKDELREMTGSEAAPVKRDTAVTNEYKKAASEYDVAVTDEILSDVEEAFESISEIDSFSEGMKKYFVATKEEVTAESLYMAKHSVMDIPKNPSNGYFAIDEKGYMAKRSETNANLDEQVCELLAGLDIEDSDTNVTAAKWLVSNSICVNKENIDAYNNLENVKLPVSKEDFARYAAVAAAEGKGAKEASLGETKTIFEKAMETTETIYVSFADKDLETIKETVTDGSYESILGRRMLEEVRYEMTTKANLMMLRRGITIDTADSKAYIDALKQMEQMTEFKEYREVITVEKEIERINESPLALVGAFQGKIGVATLPEIANTGDALKSKFEVASLAYEEVGTKVRKDLGDSIKKAFGNIDAILTDLGEELTVENRRAVKILGMNSTPINKDSIEKVRTEDAKLTHVLEKLAPSDTLKLIVNGKNPIKMSIDELNEYLDAKENDQGEKIEKYSSFLYKMEQKGNVTEEERKEYIEVYRIINRLEKTDHAAVGSLINEGVEQSLSNFKRADRSRKNIGFDETAGDAWHYIEDIESDEALEKAWRRESLLNYKEAEKVPEEVYRDLLNNGVETTAENLVAASGLMKKRGFSFSKVNEISEERFGEFEEEIVDNFNENDAKGVYDSEISKAIDSVYDKAIESESYVDVKALKLVHKELRVARAFARTENFEVPISIDGIKTSMNVKIVHSESEESGVVVSLEADSIGRVVARLCENNGKTEGIISSNNENTVMKLKKVADILGTNVTSVYSKTPETDEKLSKTATIKNDSRVSAKTLYDTAQKFMKAMKGIFNED